MPRDCPPLRVLTWQVHGNYMFYLSQVPCEWWLVTRDGHPPGYAGRTPGFPWGANVREIPESQVAEAQVDCVLYQSRRHWEADRHTLLTPAQRELPSIYLEHDPPQAHPTCTRHWADAVSLLVHVTPFNALMWDSGGIPTRVVEHAAIVPADIRCSALRSEGIAVINHLQRRGRRLGADVYRELQRQAPLRLIGMDSASMPGGLGEIAHAQLPAFIAEYRYLLNPIRWTSLGLSVVEAMLLGMPVLGLATTELVSVIENGRNGWLATDPQQLAEVMRRLSADRALALRWGAQARATAQARFGIERFVRDWCEVLAVVTTSGALPTGVRAASLA